MDPKTKYLHHAAFSGKIDIVRKLIHEFVDIDGRDEKGNAAVHKAAEGNQVEVLEMLLRSGAIINAVNNDGCTCLHVAIETRAVECVQLLLKKGVNVNHLNNYGLSALMTAIERELLYNEDSPMAYSSQEEEIIALLIDHTDHTDLKQTCDGFYKRNSLHYAAYWGCETAVAKLLEKDSSLHDVVDNDGDYPIHLAAMNGHKKVIEIILCLVPDININLRGDRSRTILHVATDNMRLSTAEMLINKNCDCNIGDIDGRTPLHYACSSLYCCSKKDAACAHENKLEHCVEIKKVYDSMADVFKKRCARLAFAIFLIQKGNADVGVKDARGTTPLHRVEQMDRDQLKSIFETSFPIKLIEIMEKFEKISGELEKMGLVIDDDRVLKVQTASLETEITDLKKRIQQLESNASEASQSQYSRLSDSCNNCVNAAVTRLLCGHQFCDYCFEQNDQKCLRCNH